MQGSVIEPLLFVLFISDLVSLFDDNIMYVGNTNCKLGMLLNSNTVLVVNQVKDIGVVVDTHLRVSLLHRYDCCARAFKRSNYLYNCCIFFLYLAYDLYNKINKKVWINLFKSALNTKICIVNARKYLLPAWLILHIYIYIYIYIVTY